MLSSSFLAIVIAFALRLTSSLASDTPEQIHLAIGTDSTKMNVQWATLDEGNTISSTTVMYGLSPDQLTFTIQGSNFTFTDSGKDKHTISHHICEMKDLKPSTKYFYKVGCLLLHEFSDVFDFTSSPDPLNPNSSPLRFGIWGDMGYNNAQILKSVLKEVADNNFDMILHVGDFGYDLHTDNGRNGDNFMNSVQPMAARVPYMVDIGNHENIYLGSHYTERFRLMPVTSGKTMRTRNGVAPNNHFYSHDYGLVKFIALSSEIFFTKPWMIVEQRKWLESELEKVDRSITPWVVVHAHRPAYCSCDKDCDATSSTIRIGFEETFHKYGVDLFIAGHEHNYERMYDVYKNETTKSTINPPATIHIVTGNAGGPENHEIFQREQPSRTAFRTDAYGYSRMQVYNTTHLHWEQVECDTDAGVQDVVIDEVWIVQENHGSFGR